MLSVPTTIPPCTSAHTHHILYIPYGSISPIRERYSLPIIHTKLLQYNDYNYCTLFLVYLTFLVVYLYHSNL